MPKHHNLWAVYYNQAKDRLKVPIIWYPYLAIIPFFLVTLLNGYTLLTASVRMGHPSTLPPFPAESQKNGAIWFSVTPIGKEIVVATASREVFKWNQNSRGIQDSRKFINWLKKRVEQEIESASLLNQVNSTRASVVISADQTLTFAHLRPIIYGLAEAGVSRYAFETLSYSETSTTSEN